MRNDITYGRIKPLSSRLQGMKPTKVKVVYSLNDFTIFPKKGGYLKFVTVENEYHIYNPFRLRINMDMLISYLKTYHCNVCHETFVSWSIEESG